MTPKIKALTEQIFSGNLKSNQARVCYFLIDRVESDTNTMRSLLFMKHQTLTSVLSTLEGMGVIYKSGKTAGCNYSNWKFESDTSEQEFRALQIRMDKLNKTCKRMEKDFSDLMPPTLKKVINNFNNVRPRIWE